MVSTPLATCLLLGVAYSASVGGMGTPVGTAPNQEFLGQFDLKFEDGPKITFGQWYTSGGPDSRRRAVVARVPPTTPPWREG